MAETRLTPTRQARAECRTGHWLAHQRQPPTRKAKNIICSLIRFPNRPDHALVYLADVKEHGLDFPNLRNVMVGGTSITKLGVDAEVAGVLSEIREKWR